MEHRQDIAQQLYFLCQKLQVKMGGEIGLEGKSRNNVTLGYLCHCFLETNALVVVQEHQMQVLQMPEIFNTKFNPNFRNSNVDDAPSSNTAI